LLATPSEFHKVILARLAPMPPLVTRTLSAVFELVQQDVTPMQAAQELGTSTLATEYQPRSGHSFRNMTPLLTRCALRRFLVVTSIPSAASSARSPVLCTVP
jgi:hypothetical protein